VDGTLNSEVLQQVGLSQRQVEEMYRYLAIANYEDRFVIPTGHREALPDAYAERSGCGFTFGNGCHGGNSEVSLFGGSKQTTTLVKPVQTFDPVEDSRHG